MPTFRVPCQTSIRWNVVEAASSSFAFTIASLSLVAFQDFGGKRLTVSLQVESVVTHRAVSVSFLKKEDDYQQARRNEIGDAGEQEPATLLSQLCDVGA